MTKISTFDLTPFYRSTVGIDSLFDRITRNLDMAANAGNYPPYNIIKNDGANYEIEIALAGFKSDEIEVSTEQNILKVASKSPKQDSERTYLHKGVSKRSFTRSWQLAEDVKVKDGQVQSIAFVHPIDLARATKSSNHSRCRSTRCLGLKQANS